jgi:predicted nucleotidyltransferase
MSVAELPIDIDQAAVAQFCVKRGIRRLSLFGSVVRSDFDKDRSDLDVFAEFEQGALARIGLGYFDFGNELSAILGRKVDFCSRLQAHVRPLAEREMVVIYERP